MKTFIRVAEIWLPNKDHTQLEFGSGLYGPFREFGSVSKETTFNYGEGLPGKAWASGHPVILKQLDPSNFKRTDAAREAGLTCGIALPIFAADYLIAVIVFFCGDDEEHVGAIEHWHNDIEDTYDLGLVDGYYGTAELFEWTSKHTKFRPGYGLPGMVWKSRMPVIMDDLGKSHRFLRNDDAVRVGINRGLGIPCSRNAQHTHVLTFMSALGTPIARRFEIWVPDVNKSSNHDSSNEALVFHAGHCDINPALAPGHISSRIGKMHGLVGKAWATGLPAISEDLAHDTSIIGLSALASGLKTMLAIPVIQEGRFKAIVTFYF